MGGVEIRRNRQAIVAGESVDKDKLQLGMAAKRRKGSEVPGEEGALLRLIVTIDSRGCCAGGGVMFRY